MSNPYLYDSPFQHPEDWKTRGYLPHFDHSPSLQFITFRLSDSLPQKLIEQISAEEDSILGFSKALDRSYGCCLLQKTEAAQIVHDAFFHFHNQHYEVLAWVIMPNHIHILIRTFSNHPLEKVIASWKRFTGRQLQDFTSIRPLWQKEYWDRFIRDEEHFWLTINYIHQNPVKAGLVSKPEDWPWSSAKGFDFAKFRDDKEL